MSLLLLFLLIDELPEIVLPVNPAVKVEIQQVQDTPVTSLSPDLFWVIECEEPLLIISSPSGIVDVVYEAGPVKCRGKFAGNPETVSTRTYSSKHLYFVEALESGEVELLIIRDSARDASEVLRQKLIVSGTGPKPPPDIEPDRVPVDDDQIPVDDTKGFRVLMLLDETADPATLAAVNSLQTRRWLDDQTDDWRRWDRSTVDADNMNDEEPVWQSIWKAAQPQLPAGSQLLVIKGKTITVRPLTSQVVQELEAMR